MNDKPSEADTNISVSDSTNSNTSEHTTEPATELQSVVTNLTIEPEYPQKKSMKWLWISIIVVVLTALAVLGYLLMNTKDSKTTTTSVPAVRIGLLLDTYQESRWVKDKKYIEERAAQKGVSVTTLIADGDDKLQLEQVENLISQQVDVLVIVPHDAATISPAVAKAKAAGIKVLSYDRLILNADIDSYVSFDNEQVGKNSAQYVVDAVAAKKSAKIAYIGGAPTDNNAALIRKGVMEVLTPLIASGTVQLVYDVPTPQWKPDLAYAGLKAYLDKGNTVDGVIAGNDGTAFGGIRALQEKGILDIPVTGQDAELTAVQRLITGTQLMTNYKSIKSLAYEAVDVAIEMAQGNAPKQTAKLPNGFKDVPSYLLIPIPVTKANIDATIIKDGFYTKTEIYGR